MQDIDLKYKKCWKIDGNKSRMAWLFNWWNQLYWWISQWSIWSICLDNDNDLQKKCREGLLELKNSQTFRTLNYHLSVFGADVHKNRTHSKTDGGVVSQPAKKSLKVCFYDQQFLLNALNNLMNFFHNIIKKNGTNEKQGTERIVFHYFDSL